MLNSQIDLTSQLSTEVLEHRGRIYGSDRDRDEGIGVMIRRKEAESHFVIMDSLQPYKNASHSGKFIPSIGLLLIIIFLYLKTTNSKRKCGYT